MIACVDVHYRDSRAIAAGLLFEDWAAPCATLEVVRSVAPIAPYEPGRFYLRELPCIMAVLEKLPTRPAAIVIDGYVWLGDESRPGLGARLHRALGGKAAVIGVAKSAFCPGPAVRELVRGRSLRPLYVTAAGLPVTEAVACVAAMHGSFRIPTLVKRADTLSRAAA